jgi:acyl-coenzyme A synthetase/AMP-(fatty) acid ligase
VFAALCDVLDDEPVDFKRVRYLMSGGQPLTSRLAHRLSRHFGQSRMVNMYGCTENAPRIAFAWLPEPVPERESPWPVGRAVAGTQIAVVDGNGDG